MTEGFKYKVDENFNHTVDEKGNAFIALRYINWGDSETAKLDLRKYYATSEGERMNKGVSFLTEEGPHELTRVLIDNNFGNAEEIANSIRNNRPDILKELAKDIETIKENPDFKPDDYYDPRELLG